MYVANYKEQLKSLLFEADARQIQQKFILLGKRGVGRHHVVVQGKAHKPNKG